MGLYIQAPTHHGKLEYILDTIGGSKIDAPEEFMAELDENCLVCVVDNGIFEAAGVCYDEIEFQAFTEPNDLRHKEWALIPRAPLVTFLSMGGHPEAELRRYGLLREGE